jgi:hypothetical protein
MLITIFYAVNFQTDYRTVFNPPPKSERMVTTFFKWYITCSYASSVSHPAFCSVGMGVALVAADHPCPFTVRVVLCLCVYVCGGAKLSLP